MLNDHAQPSRQRNLPASGMYLLASVILALNLFGVVGFFAVFMAFMLLVLGIAMNLHGVGVSPKRQP